MFRSIVVLSSVLLHWIVDAGEIQSARLIPIDASCVRLLEGPFKERQELHRTGRLREFNLDRLLFPYRAATGLPQAQGVDAGYGGWDDGFIRGHMAGHYLSAASRMFAATGDSLFRDRANALVDGLDQCQKAFGSGHLAAFPEEVLSAFEGRGGEKHGILVPYYTIHKVMAGLLDAHHDLGNAKALEMAGKMADCYARRMTSLSPEQIEKLLRTDQERNPVTEFGCMADALSELARASGDERHLKLAQVFIRDWFVHPLAAGEDRLGNLHANTHVAQAVGVAHYANRSGDAVAAAASRNFWEMVTKHRSFVIGGNSFKEWFDKPDVEAGPCIDENRILPYNTAETCNTHNMLKLSRRLLECATDQAEQAAVGDYMERALYNHLLSSIDPVSGRVTYFHPLHGDFKTYLKGFECCEGSGIENTGRYGEGIYFRNDDSLYINLYIPSEVKWKEKGLVIRQEGNIPWQDSVTFNIVRAEKPVIATLRFRQPGWIASRAAIISEGESSVSGEVGNDPVISITRAWKTGDQFRIKLPAMLRMLRTKDVPEMVSLAYGPLVLAARLGKTGMPDDVNDKDVARSISRPEVPEISVASEDPARWLDLTDRKSLRFRAHDCGPASGLVFEPVHEIHHERFAVYLRKPLAGSVDRNP